MILAKADEYVTKSHIAQKLVASIFPGIISANQFNICLTTHWSIKKLQKQLTK